jgi:nucleoside diphosphate kinase
VGDAYGDFVPDPERPGRALYFEPAVITARDGAEAAGALLMMADFLDGRENMEPAAPGSERTLVILKPDNWARRSSRPGAIIDMLARSGLRIVGAKMHRLSPARAMEFYGPVEAVLRERLAPRFAARAARLLEREFGFRPGAGTERALADSFGVECAANEFASLVAFMCGRRPEGLTPEELERPGDARCMILVYEGEDAVRRVRAILGPTDPAEAPEGTIRGEFGSTVMINAAHASDSTESFLREAGVVRMDLNDATDAIRARPGVPE